MKNYINSNIVQNSDIQIDQYINYLAMNIFEKISNQYPFQCEIDLDKPINYGISKSNLPDKQISLKVFNRNNSPWKNNEEAHFNSL